VVGGDAPAPARLADDAPAGGGRAMSAGAVVAPGGRGGTAGGPVAGGAAALLGLIGLI